MKMIEIRPDCFLNMETIVLIEKEPCDDGCNFVSLTTVTGNVIELEQDFDEFMTKITI